MQFQESFHANVYELFKLYTLSCYPSFQIIIISSRAFNYRNLYMPKSKTKNASKICSWPWLTQLSWYVWLMWIKSSDSTTFLRFNVISMDIQVDLSDIKRTLNADPVGCLTEWLRREVLTLDVTNLREHPLKFWSSMKTKCTNLVMECCDEYEDVHSVDTCPYVPPLSLKFKYKSHRMKWLTDILTLRAISNTIFYQKISFSAMLCFIHTCWGNTSWNWHLDTIVWFNNVWQYVASLMVSSDSNVILTSTELSVIWKHSCASIFQNRKTVSISEKVSQARNFCCS